MLKLHNGNAGLFMSLFVYRKGRGRHQTQLITHVCPTSRITTIWRRVYGWLDDGAMNSDCRLWEDGPSFTLTLPRRKACTLRTCVVATHIHHSLLPSPVFQFFRHHVDVGNIVSTVQCRSCSSRRHPSGPLPTSWLIEVMIGHCYRTILCDAVTMRDAAQSTANPTPDRTRLHGNQVGPDVPLCPKPPSIHDVF